MLAAKRLRLRWKRRGLMRERARLHQEAAGIQWLLKQNEREAIACEKELADLDALRRINRFQRRYKCEVDG